MSTAAGHCYDPLVRARALILCVTLFSPAAANAQTTTSDAPVTDEYRVTIFPHHPIKGDLSGFGYLGWVTNPDADYKLYYGGFPGLIYTFSPWLQAWGGLLGIYTDNETAANGKSDTMELRPFAGAKLFLPNSWKWNIYNFTRLEVRETYHHDTHAWTHAERLRMRFGVEIPLASRERAWQVKTFYLIANTEPMYRFDNDVIDPARVQAGLGWVMNDRIRPELLYYANWGRTGPDNALTYNENIFRLNVKVGFNHGLLGRVWNP